MIDFARVKGDTVLRPLLRVGHPTREAAMKAANIPRQALGGNSPPSTGTAFRIGLAGGAGERPRPDPAGRKVCGMRQRYRSECRGIGPLKTPAKQKSPPKCASASGTRKEFRPVTDQGVVVTNPPRRAASEHFRSPQHLQKKMGEVFSPQLGLNYYIISPDEDFERIFRPEGGKTPEALQQYAEMPAFMYY